MMIAVYIVIIILVFATYLDWRATLCCTVPLTFATMLGYAFMDLAQIGLKSINFTSYGFSRWCWSRLCILYIQ